MSFLAIAMLVVSCLVAYLLCGVPFGYIVAQRKGVDVRKVGSGNIGSTNVARTLGKGAGGLTLALDVAKAAVAAALGYLLVGVIGLGDIALTMPGGAYDWTMALVYLACVVGHTFTPFLKFKGGKGIAVGFGGAVVIMPLVGLCLWIPFLVFAVATRIVSVGSIVAAATLPFLAWIFYQPSLAFECILSGVALLVIWSHRANIKRLLAGTEKRFSFKRDPGATDDAVHEGK